MNRLFATTALVTALALSPALAQQSGGQPQGSDELLKQQESAPPEKMLENQPQDQAPQGQAAQAPMSQEVEFVTEQNPSDWLASSLIGRTVYNEQEEDLGDISDVIFGEDGQVVAILIGVGGFLGIGEKDVGVQFSALQFRLEAEVESGQPEDTRETGAMDRLPATGEQAPAGEVQGEAEIQAQKDQQQATGEPPAETQTPMAATETPPIPGQAPGALSDSDRQTMAAEEDADHSNIIIVLNTTREQLDAAPAFTYLDEQGDDSASRTAPAAQPEEGAPAGSQEKKY